MMIRRTEEDQIDTEIKKSPRYQLIHTHWTEEVVAKPQVSSNTF